MGDRSALAYPAVRLTRPARFEAHGVQRVDIGCVLDRFGVGARVAAR